MVRYLIECASGEGISAYRYGNVAPPQEDVGRYICRTPLIACELYVIGSSGSFNAVIQLPGMAVPVEPPNCATSHIGNVLLMVCPETSLPLPAT